jgi:hypothetical protein
MRQLAGRYDALVKRVGLGCVALLMAVALSGAPIRLVPVRAAATVVLTWADDGKTVTTAIGTTIVADVEQDASSSDAHVVMPVSSVQTDTGPKDTFRAAGAGTAQITGTRVTVTQEPCPTLPGATPGPPCFTHKDPAHWTAFGATIIVTPAVRSPSVPTVGSGMDAVAGVALLLAGASLIAAALAKRRR